MSRRDTPGIEPKDLTKKKEGSHATQYVHTQVVEDYLELCKR